VLLLVCDELDAGKSQPGPANRDLSVESTDPSTVVSPD